MSILRTCSLTPLLSLAVLALAGVAPVRAQVSMTEVALSRSPLPSFSTNIRMGSFGAPTINSRGAVAFYCSGFGAGIGATNDTFVAVIRKGTARVIAREGQLTYLVEQPTYDGAYFSSFGTSPQINSKFFVSLTAEVAEFQTVNGTTTYDFNTRLLSGNGSRNLPIYSFFPSGNAKPFTDFNARREISLIANNGDSPPDFPLSVFRESLRSRIPLVAVGGTPVGLPLGSTYTTFGDPTLDDTGRVYFAADISDADTAFDGVWFGKNGDPEPLLLKGDNAPATAGNATTFTDFAAPVVPSSTGKYVAFAASTSAGTNAGVWIIDTNSREIRTVATTTTNVTGYPDGLANFQPPAVNNLGNVVFGVKSTSTTSTDIERIDALFFVRQPGETPIKIIAKGDTMRVRGQDTVVVDIRFSPTGGLNNVGRVAFTASFRNRTSGIFVAKP